MTSESKRLKTPSGRKRSMESVRRLDIIKKSESRRRRLIALVDKGKDGRTGA